MDDLVLAAITLSLLAASIIYYYSKTETAAQPLPPGPWGLPILGYLPFLNPNLHHQFTHLSQKHGPIYSLQLGRKFCVVISSSPLIKQVVRDQDAIFANRDPPAAAVVGTGGVDIVWSPNGPYWRDLRKLFVREMLSNTNLQVMRFGVSKLKDVLTILVKFLNNS